LRGVRPYTVAMVRVLLALLCLVFVVGCDKVPKPATEVIDERNAAAAARMPKDPFDAKVFTELKAAGHDFKKATKVDFYLTFPEEAAARGVIHVLSPDGYAGDIKQDQGQWVCHLQKEMVLTADVIDMERFKFRDLTVNSGGQYDGWGAPAVK
jgi:hypothetical protein